jgi:hypothetical protein
VHVSISVSQHDEQFALYIVYFFQLIQFMLYFLYVRKGRVEEVLRLLILSSLISVFKFMCNILIYKMPKLILYI